MLPGVVGIVPVPIGRVASRVALGAVVVPGEYTVPGVAPTGATPPGVARVPLVVPLIAPVVVVLLGTVPMVVPGWPGAPAPVMGAVGAPGVTGTVWAKAVVLRPSPRRAAKANAVAFIRRVRISKGKEACSVKQPRLA